MKFFLISCLLLLSLSSIRSDAVCSLSMLVAELQQDVADNGKLDCLRKPLPAPKNKPESPEEKKLRLDGAWDSDCAFEADYDWLSNLKKHFALQTGLVDRDGKAVETPFSDQPDMCEIVRALIAGNIFEGTKLDALNEDSFASIDCPGNSDDQDLQICAATGGSSSQKYTWNILLTPSSIVVNDSTIRPKWALENKSREKLESRKQATA